MIKQKEFLIDPLGASKSLADLDTSLKIAGYSEINRSNLGRPETREYRIGFYLSLIAKLVNCLGFDECDLGKNFLKHNEASIEYYLKGIKILSAKFDRDGTSLFHVEDINFYDNKGKLGIEKFSDDFEGFLQSILEETKDDRTDQSNWNWCAATDLNTMITKLVVDAGGIGTSLISWLFSAIKKKRNYRILGFYTVRGTLEEFKDITGIEWSEDLDS